MNGNPVAVIGAGWAGLTAALVLSRAGRKVVLIEAAAMPGGRARTVHSDGARLDNGQHILVGACRHALSQMRAVGVNPLLALHPVPFRLLMRRRVSGGAAESFLLAPRSTRTRDLGAAFYEASRDAGLPRRLLGLAGAWRMLHRPLTRDLPVADWLRANAQPSGLRERVWEPLCLAVMNTPPAEASARVFQSVLRQSLLAGDGPARLLIPRRPLGELFAEPALQQLRTLGASIRLATRVRGIEARGGDGFLLTLRGGETLAAGQVVLAAAQRSAARLLPAEPVLDPLRRDLVELGERSICTVYLRYAKAPPELPPLIGLLGQHGQWLVPRRLVGDPHWLSVVISAADQYPMPDADSRWRRVGRELAQTLPGLGEPQQGRVICERMATLDARPGLDDRRPDTRTPLPGLYLAGDFCARGLPSTLEAAVQSGQKAAAAAITDGIPDLVRAAG
ncbi:MAG: FAD-dependent oxidoreductase [Thioalkalivibrio sp.]|nr:MAG: FAD-dependent oxidoreductase [Thioalkalivibrio sp.]